MPKVIITSAYVLDYVITSDKGGGRGPKCVCPRLSVCLRKITQKRVRDLDEMLHVDRCRDMDELINF